MQLNWLAGVPVVCAVNSLIDPAQPVYIAISNNNAFNVAHMEKTFNEVGMSHNITFEHAVQRRWDMSFFNGFTAQIPELMGHDLKKAYGSTVSVYRDEIIQGEQADPQRIAVRRGRPEEKYPVLWHLSRLSHRENTGDLQEYLYPRTGGAGVKIYLIDSGVSHHNELIGRVTLLRNFVQDESFTDYTGHGTACASLAAGTYTGLAPRAHINAIKIANEQGRASSSLIVSGLLYAAQHAANERGGIRPPPTDEEDSQAAFSANQQSPMDPAEEQQSNAPPDEEEAFDPRAEIEPIALPIPNPEFDELGPNPTFDEYYPGPAFDEYGPGPAFDEYAPGPTFDEYGPGPEYDPRLMFKRDLTGINATQALDRRQQSPESMLPIISLSMGTGSAPIQKAIASIGNQFGYPVFLSAGNNRMNDCDKRQNGFLVGGISSNDSRWDDGKFGSHWGDCISINGPADDVRYAHYGDSNRYGTGDGTSYATPMVAGIAALYISDNPTAYKSDLDVYSKLQDAATEGIIKGLKPGTLNLLAYNRPDN